MPAATDASQQALDALAAWRADPAAPPPAPLDGWTRGGWARRLARRTLVASPGLAALLAAGGRAGPAALAADAAAWRQALAAAEPAERARLTASYVCLCYHRVTAEPLDGWERYTVAPATFRRQMDRLRRWGYVPLTVDRLVAFHEGRGTLPRRGVVVTLDDGYPHAVAAAVAERRMAPQVFVPTREVGTRPDWAGGERLATWPQLAGAGAAGVAVGSHARLHVPLPERSGAALADEVRGSADDLAARLPAAVGVLAYPNGRYDASVLAEAAAAGYRLAWTTRTGANGLGTPPLELRRVSAKDWDGWLLLRLKLAAGAPLPGSAERFLRADAPRRALGAARRRLRPAPGAANGPPGAAQPGDAKPGGAQAADPGPGAAQPDPGTVDLPGDPPASLSVRDPLTVSVVMPCHDAEPYLREAVDSVLSQEPPPLELVVCDDASTDGSAAVLASYGDRVRVVRHGRCGGEAAARNSAVAAARGELVSMVDADDAFLPGRLAALLDLFARRPDPGLVVTDTVMVADGEVVGWYYGPENPFAERDQRVAILRGNFLNSHVTVRTDLIRSFGGFDESVPVACDWEMWIRMVVGGVPVTLLPAPLSAYRQHAASLSAGRQRLLESCTDFLARTLARPDLDDAQRAALLDKIHQRRTELARVRMHAVLPEGGPGARRAAAAVAVDPRQPPRSRVLAAAAAVAPGAVARLPRRA